VPYAREPTLRGLDLQKPDERRLVLLLERDNMDAFARHPNERLQLLRKGVAWRFLTRAAAEGTGNPMPDQAGEGMA
jgi:hypothetical protein